MDNKKDRTPDVQFYDWNPKRWLDSDARHELDPLSRGIYRDCLDLCYLHGSIPKNLEILASKCLVSREEMEVAWPKIERHFHVHKHNGSQLVNKYAELWRRKYQSYVKAQRTRRKLGIDKAKRDRELRDAGRVQTEPPLNGGRSELDTTLTSTPTVTVTVNKKHKQARLAALELAQQAWFEEFWEIVWAKIARATAWKAWKVRVHDEETKDKLIKAAIAQGPAILERAQRSGSAILHPATWINAERCDDEIQESPPFPQETKASRQFRNMLAVINPEGEK